VDNQCLEIGKRRRNRITCVVRAIASGVKPFGARHGRIERCLRALLGSASLDRKLQHLKSLLLTSLCT
jgi:hypothetical protein